MILYIILLIIVKYNYLLKKLNELSYKNNNKYHSIKSLIMCIIF